MSKTNPTASKKAKPSTKGKASPPPAAASKATPKPKAKGKEAPVKTSPPSKEKPAAKKPPTSAKSTAKSSAKKAPEPLKGKAAAKKPDPKKAVAPAAPAAKKTPATVARPTSSSNASSVKASPPPASKKPLKSSAPKSDSKKSASPAPKASPVAKKSAPAKSATAVKGAKSSKDKTTSVTPIIVEAEPEPEVVAAPLPARAKRNELPDFPPGPTANGAIYYDTHMHTPLCKHAWGEPEEYAAQAIQAGLKGIIFTCHCPMPDGFWPSVRMSNDEFDTYVALVDRTANAFKDKLDVRLGLESEFYPGVEPWIEKLHQRADFHYLLGAVHWQSRDYLAKFETGTIEAFRKTYFNHLAASAESGLYDCLAHPDLVKNYHPDSWCLAIVKDSIASALDRIAKTGVAMELNTSGLNKSYSEMNPGLEMLRMMADREIPIVVASDAHRPHRVGEQFMTALSHLQEAGYDQVSYFLQRKRIDLKIAAVQASIKKAADSQLD